jgi:hypothetical protein
MKGQFDCIAQFSELRHSTVMWSRRGSFDRWKEVEIELREGLVSVLKDHGMAGKVDIVVVRKGY